MISFFKTLFGVVSLLMLLVTSTQAATFIDNKDGTIFDGQTNLMWQQADDGTERIWTEAVKYCENLELAGHSDWQLPKIFMLEGLIDSGQSPTINPIFSVKPSYYWSSSESRTSVKSAKYVNFFYGNTYAYSKDNTYYALCVRDSSGDKASPLVADFTYSKGPQDSTVQFTAEISGGSEPFFREWDFGDGDTSSMTNPIHDFHGEGAYTITLTVSDNGGSIAVSTQKILLPLGDTVADPVMSEEPDGQVKEGAVPQETAVDSADEVAVDFDAVSKEVEALQPDFPDSVLGEVSTVDGAVISDVVEKISPLPVVEDAMGEIISSDAVEIPKPVPVGEAKTVDDLLQAEADLAVFDAAGQDAEPKNGEDVSFKSISEQELFVESEGETEVVPDPQLTDVDVEKLAKEALLSAERVVSSSAPESAIVDAAPEVVILSPKPPVDKEILETPEAIETPQSNEAPVEKVESDAAVNLEPIEALAEVQSSALEPQLQVVDSADVAVSPERRSVLQIFAATHLPLVDPVGLGHQLLAYAFANAVKGDADLNKDTKVTANELNGYLNIAMDALSEGKQKPSVSIEGESFPLCSEKESTYAFVVGADTFNQGLDSWPYAVESAELVRKSIEESCQKVKTISLSGKHASRQGVLQALMQIKSLVQPADSLVFYFAGKSGYGSGGRLIFSLFDTVSEMSSLTGLYYSDVLGFIDTMKLGQVTLLLETSASDSNN